MKNKRAIVLVAILALLIVIAWIAGPKPAALKKPVAVCGKAAIN
jgi:hypothetical protein